MPVWGPWLWDWRPGLWLLRTAGLVDFSVDSPHRYALLCGRVEALSKMVQLGTGLMRFRVTHHPAASRQPDHKTAFEHYLLPKRTSLLKWHVLLLIKVRKQLQPGGALCPLNSSVFVYHTLAYLHVDSSYVWFYRFTVTGTGGWLRSLTLLLALRLFFCEPCFWNVTGTSFFCFCLAF